MTTTSTRLPVSVWQVQDAKSRLAELIGRVGTIGPQTITRHGKPVAVVISPQAARQVAANLRPTFGEFLLAAPRVDAATARLLVRPRRSRRQPVQLA